MGLKQIYIDIKEKLGTITDDAGNNVFQTIRVWNNQIARVKEGSYAAYARPAAFVEVINDVQYQQLGEGYQTADLGIRIHIDHEWYDAQDGNFEEDLAVIEIKDLVRAQLSYFMPSKCNEIISTGEEEDYDHDNEYHYVLNFLTNFIDSTVHDQLQKKYITKDAPTDLEIDVLIADRLVQQNTYTVAQPLNTLSGSVVCDTPGQNVFFLTDDGGASLQGCEVALVIKEIKPFRNNQWSWDKNSGFLTITDASVYVDAGETITYIYTKVVS